MCKISLNCLKASAINPELRLIARLASYFARGGERRAQAGLIIKPNEQIGAKGFNSLSGKMGPVFANASLA